MRMLDPALTAQLAAGVTTLCRCWRIDRPDGVSLGFTDHDQRITFDGVAFEAEAGALGSAIEASAGLDVDTTEMIGALRSDAITDGDVDRGRYDGAEVRQWIVDWSSPSVRLLVFRGSLGEIRRRGHAFEAELLGIGEALRAPIGRQIIGACDAALGDARCGVDLSSLSYRASVTVSSVDSVRRFRVTGAETFSSGWFSGGRFLIDESASTALDVRVASHRRDAAAVDLGDIIDLEDSLLDPLAIGQTAVLVAGCDKQFETCAGKFTNKLNFRGFPHVPGDDWLLAYPRSGDVLDGGSTRSG